MEDKVTRNTRYSASSERKSTISGEQAIEVPNRERMKSERLKELRRRQREEEMAARENTEYEMIDETRGEY